MKCKKELTMPKKNKMNKILKFVWISLFTIIIYCLIAFAVSTYVSWIIQKSIIWILIITFLLITIPRIILNKIPILIGNINGYTDEAMKIVSIISWVIRILYLIFIIFTIDMSSINGIMNGVLCYLLFLGLGNFFNHGLLFHILKQ